MSSQPVSDSPPMRITQTMLSAGFGGAERLFVDLCLGLAEAGHEVQAVCHPAFHALSALRRDRIRIDTLKVRSDWSLLARRRLKRILMAFEPAVIHSHLARGSMITGSAAKSLGIPVLANIHNYIKLKYYRNVHHFCPGTHDLKKYLIGRGVRAEAVTVIPHFSPLPAASEAASPPPDSESPVVLSYGRFVRKKGFHVLLQSLGVLREKGLEIRLILGGAGPEDAALRQQTADLGLDAQVHFSGWVDDTRKFLARSPYFILPSLDEPFGIVVLEAMSQGRVIIASTSQGPREVLDDSTAYLFPPDDPGALAEAVAQAVQRPETAFAKAEAALGRFKTTYSKERIVGRYVQLFRELAARPPEPWA